MQAGTEERNENNKQAKDEMYIGETVKSAYNDIQRNIASYIQTEGVMQLGLRAEDIGAIKNILADSCRTCMREMSERHSQQIDGVTQMIQEQVGELQKNVQIVMEKGMVKEQPSNSFDQYVLKGEELARFNEGANKAVIESQQPKEHKEIEYKSLPDNVIE